LISIQSGNTQECATIPSEKQIAYTRSFELGNTRNLRIAKGIVDIPIQIHIITDEEGNGAIDQELLSKYIVELNDIYLKANIRFILNGPIRTLKSSKYHQFDIELEEEMASKNDLSNALNIYIPESIVGGYYGYTYHPEKAHKNRMVISQDGFHNQSTFPHEMGHFFGLYHTHGKGNSQSQNNEPIARNSDKNNNGIVDCYETGDDLCDTPADPNLGLEEYREYCLENCEMQSKIPNQTTGEYYEPLITNIMCYNKHPSCRREFTQEQLTRIAQTARNERKHLRKQKPISGEIIKGQIGFYQFGGKPMPLSLDINLYQFDHKYYQNDSFYFEIQNASTRKIYLSIINMDAKEKVNKVYPYPGDLKYIVSKEKVNPLNGYINLDNTIGKEYTCMLLSYFPINGDNLVKSMRSARGTFTQRIYSSLGNALLPLDHVRYKEGQKIDFQGTLTDLEILPIMIEMEHGY
tara:strand:- start:1580 stop:2971 length:1392 start_codon:yes stop_codon:yes gene_type:complete